MSLGKALLIVTLWISLFSCSDQNLVPSCIKKGKVSGPIHYLEHGSGAPIVLIHGAASNLHVFEASPIVQPLARKFRVINIDRPGMGHSKIKETNEPLAEQVLQLDQFFEREKIKNPVLVAHSLGAAVAMGYAVTFPKKVKGLVLIAGAMSPLGSGESWYTKLALMPVVGLVFRYTLIPLIGPQMLDAGIERNFNPNPIQEDFVSRSCIKLLFQPSVFYQNAKDLHHIFDYTKSIYHRYSEVTAPVSLIYGNQDSIINEQKHVELFLQKLPATKVNWLKNTGHLPHLFHSELVVNEIMRIAK